MRCWQQNIVKRGTDQSRLLTISALMESCFQVLRKEKAQGEELADRRSPHLLNTRRAAWLTGALSINLHCSPSYYRRGNRGTASKRWCQDSSTGLSDSRAHVPSIPRPSGPGETSGPALRRGHTLGRACWLPSARQVLLCLVPGKERGFCAH